MRFGRLVATAVVIFICGCGSGTSGTSGTPDSRSVAAYQIGAVLEKSGDNENWGKASEEGMQLAIDQLNHPGIDLLTGKPVEVEFGLELYVEDNKSTPEQSANAFITLVNVKHVLAVLGAVASSDTRAMKEQANKLHVPIVTHASTNVQLTKDTDWLFRACWNDAFQGTVCANFALDTLKAKKAVIVTDAGQDYSRGLSKNYEETYKKNGGTVAGELTYLKGDKIFTSQVEKLKAMNPDCVFCSGYAAEVALLLKTAREAGFEKPILGGDGLDDKQFYAIAGPLAGTGVYLCNHAHNDDPDPKVQTFVQAFKAKYNEPPQNAMAFLAYDAVFEVHDAIKRARAKGAVTPESVRDGLASIKDLPLVTGTITVGPDHEVSKRAVVVKYQADGSLKFVVEVKP